MTVQFSISEQLLHINVQRFRGGLVFKAHRLCVSLNSRLESNKEEEPDDDIGRGMHEGDARDRLFVSHQIRHRPCLPPVPHLRETTSLSDVSPGSR